MLLQTVFYCAVRPNPCIPNLVPAVQVYLVVYLHKDLEICRENPWFQYFPPPLVLKNLSFDIVSTSIPRDLVTKPQLQ